MAKAIKLTGHLLLGIPIIAQHTEAEKNRQVKTTEGADGNTNSVPFHRLYVGNVHFSITEEDLENVFNPFGELEFVQLQKDDTNRSRGYGFVQYVLYQYSIKAKPLTGIQVPGPRSSQVCSREHEWISAGEPSYQSRLGK